MNEKEIVKRWLSEKMALNERGRLKINNITIEIIPNSVYEYDPSTGIEYQKVIGYRVDAIQRDKKINIIGGEFNYINKPEDVIRATLNFLFS